MKAIIDFLTQNWFAAAVALLSVALGVWSVFESRRHRGPRLCYQIIGQRLIRKHTSLISDQDLNIKYKNEPVNALSITQIILWNDGNLPIRSSDIAKSDQLKVKIEDCKAIFSFEILKNNQISNEVKITKVDNSTVLLEFDFIEVNKGLLISILHDSENTKPIFTGTVIGQNDKIKYLGRFFALNRNIVPSNNYDGPVEYLFFRFYAIFNKFDQILISTLFCVGLFLIFMPLSLNYFEKITASEKDISVVLGTTSLIYGLILFFLTRRKFPAALLPDEYST